MITRRLSWEKCPKYFKFVVNYNNYLNRNLFSDFRDPSHHHNQPPPQQRQQQQHHHQNPPQHPHLHSSKQQNVTPSSSHSSPTEQISSSHTNSNPTDQNGASTDSTHGTSGSTIFLDEETVNKVKKTTADSIHEINKVYHDMEQNLMKRINESNTQRFRLILIGSILIIVWISAVFGARIKRGLANQTAGLAKETLENESLKIQTQELATAVVHTVLNDKDIASQAITFLREATTAQETQEALLQLTLHILQHPDTVKQLSVLVQKLANDLSQDKETIEATSNLLANALVNPICLNALYHVLTLLCQDKQVSSMVSAMVRNILDDADVMNTTKTVLMNSTQSVLVNDEIILRSKEFVTDVMGDDALQKEGGMAIFNSVSHALKPGLWRVAGMGLVFVSVGLIRVLLSPF